MMFRGRYEFLSNFYYAPFVEDGIEYPTVEHFFQAQKTFDEGDRKLIASASTPGLAKRMGRRVSLRKDWDSARIDVMEAGLRAKFSDPFLKNKLVQTYPLEIVEDNSWKDYFWGRCNGRGSNHLGRLLMKIRGEVMEDTSL